MIEGLKNPAGPDGLGVFGKGKRQAALRNVLQALAGFGDDDEIDDENELSMLARVKPKSGSTPIYDPNRLYGSLYQMYGGRRLRGGLLGD